MGKAVKQPQDVQCWTRIILLGIGNYLKNLRKIINKDRNLMGLVTNSGDSDFDSVSMESMTTSEATTKGEQQQGSQEGTFDRRLNQKITLSKLNDDSSTNDQWIWLTDVQRYINSGCSMDILESEIDRSLSNGFWGVWFCQN